MTDATDVVVATVRVHDPSTGGGSALLDDGTERAYDAAAFATGGLLLLRAGQRVHLHLRDGAVVSVALPT